MGSFLSHLQNVPAPQSNPLLHNSISKLREYHGSFKSVCDTFSIDLTEYEQIFGSNEAMFQIWDTDNNGLINALELFSGLIIFAESKFEEKARFLFDLFDFNELNSLSLIDLEFLLLSCANATYKILRIQPEVEVNEEEISEFLNNFFAEDTRVNISQLLKWCVKTQEICEFFSLIKKDSPELKANAPQSTMQKKIDLIHRVLNKEFGQKLLLPDDSRPFFDNRPLGDILNTKAYYSKIEWISNLTKRVFNQNQSFCPNSQRDVFVKMNWVYGFRSKDVRRPIAYIRQQQDKELIEKLLYFTACVIVIYFPKINEQKHYLEHDSEVISLAVAKNQVLVASGEYAEYPAIHLWDSNTLQNLGVIKGVHQKGIHLITFFHQDEFIASCGIRVNTPILIYNIKTTSLVLSVNINEFAIELLTIKNFVGFFKTEAVQPPSSNADPFENYKNSFIICTLKSILLFQYQEGHFLTKELFFDLHGIVSPLTCATALRINLKSPYLKAYQEDNSRSIIILTGHENGTVNLWENFETVDQIYQDRKEKKDQIVCITSYTYGIIIGTDASTIILLDFTFKNVLKTIDLSQFGFKLFNYNISDIIAVGEKILVATTDGDIVEIFLQQKQEHQNNSFVNKLRANRINYITSLGGQQNALCILERMDSDDKLVFTAGSQSMVYGFSHETHEIVDVWTIGDQITAMDCINFEDGGTVFALGTIGGKIYLRIDWEESPRSYDCKSQINDLKFSSDTSCLVCAANDAYVYVFFLNNNSYFQTSPKKMRFEGEIPICLDFVDDCKAFLVGTTTKFIQQN